MSSFAVPGDLHTIAWRITVCVPTTFAKAFEGLGPQGWSTGFRRGESRVNS
jgi:hypothetical protein